MQIDSWSFFDAGTFRLVGVVGADHALRWFDDFPSFNEADQSLLELQIAEGLFLVSHSKADHAQSPTGSQGVALSLKAFVAAWSLADLRKSHLRHCAVACAFMKQADSEQCAGLDVDGDFNVNTWRQQGWNVKD